jgi:hypothetical protein
MGNFASLVGTTLVLDAAEKWACLIRFVTTRHSIVVILRQAAVASGRFAPIVLKKSFFADDRKFSGSLVHLSRCDVRDHINCCKNDR